MASVDYKRELTDLIDIVVSEKGSDLHLSAGSHPILRITGSLVPLLKKPTRCIPNGSGPRRKYSIRRSPKTMTTPWQMSWFLDVVFTPLVALRLYSITSQISTLDHRAINALPSVRSAACGRGSGRAERPEGSSPRQVSPLPAPLRRASW